MSVRDLDDYLRHIQNNMHPLFIKNIAKEMKEKDDEIERQKEIIKQLDIKNLELTTTLKEVRELCLMFASGRLERTNYDDILEILDKENNNEDN